jgi:glycosyltransferase involved in cell wall biosynthesis
VHGLADFVHDCRHLWLARRKDYDAIQLRDKTFIGLVALAIAWWRGMPFFYWMSFPYGPSLLQLARTDAVRRNLPRRFYLWWRGAVGDWLLHAIVLRCADHVFVQSDRMLEDLSARGVARERMTAVPMCIDPDRFATALPSSFLPSIAADSRVVGYLGEASKARRMDFLIAAVARARESVPNIYLLIVGDAILPEEQAWLRERVASAGMTEHCHITGWLAPEAATETLGAAEICLALMAPDPILDSTTPTKLVEYLAMGRPVVANDHPDQTRVLEASGAGTVAPYIIDEYAAAIVRLLAMRERHGEIGAQGRTFVLDERAYPTMARRLAARYRALLGKA